MTGAASPSASIFIRVNISIKMSSSFSNISLSTKTGNISKVITLSIPYVNYA